MILNGEVVGTQDVAVPSGESKLVRLKLSNVARGDYSVDMAVLTGSFTSSFQVNWWLIGTLIGLAIVGLGVFATQLQRKKRIQ